MPFWLYLTALVLVVLLDFAFRTGLLWAMMKLCRVRRMSFWRALGIVAAALPLGVGAAVASLGGQLALVLILWLANAVTIAVLIRRWGKVRWARAILTMLAFVVAAGIATIPQEWALRRTIMDSYNPSPGSMSPALIAGDRFIADRTLTPRRWDIIVYRSPLDGRTVFVQRLIGLPGETIEIIEGRIHVNGAEAPLPRADWPDYQSRDHPRYGPPRGVEGSPVTLGPDEFFVIGDNSMNSEDSRHTPAVHGYQPGAVPRGHVLGVARVIHWPWSRMRIIR